MADYLVTDTELTSVANAIRTKGGTSANLSFPTEFVSAINAISGGGGSPSFDVFGLNAEFIAKVYENEVALADTDFATWTPTTSQKTIYTAKTGSQYITDIESGTCGFGVEWKFLFNPVYLSGADGKAQIIKYVVVNHLVRFRYPSTYANLINGVRNQMGITFIPVATTSGYNSIAGYYNASGTETIYTSNFSYGIYPASFSTPNIGSISSGGKSYNYITPIAPAVYAKANTTYMKASNMEQLDQTNSKFKIICNFYKIPFDDSIADKQIDSIVDAYLNWI